MIVAVDPGVDAAVCCVAPPAKILSVIGVDGLDPRVAVTLLHKAKSMENSSGPVQLVIEGQWTPRPTKPGDPPEKKRTNPKTLEKLYASRFAWQTVAMLMGIPFVIVKPATWQTVMKGIVKKDAAGNKRKIKARSMEFARGLWPHVPNDHYADAIAMALWRADGGTVPEERD